jgi:hypothetical protein
MRMLGLFCGQEPTLLAINLADVNIQEEGHGSYSNLGSPSARVRRYTTWVAKAQDQLSSYRP